MKNAHAVQPMQVFHVIHPLDDVYEGKRNSQGISKIEMSTSVKLSLWVLRIYLIFMTVMLVYHVLDLAAIFGKH